MATLDVTAGYMGLNFSNDRAQLWAKDLNNSTAITKYLQEKGVGGVVGWSSFALNASGLPHEVGAPEINLVKSRPRPTLTKSGRYEFEVIGTTCRYRYNNGTWSGATPVVLDSITWNLDVAGSGIDLVLKTPFGGNTFSLVMSNVSRIRGAEALSTGVANEINVSAGEWLFEGNFFTTPSFTYTGVATNEILYLTLTEQTIDYTSDSNLSHYLGDGRYLPNSPTATKLAIKFKKALWSAVPDDGVDRVLPFFHCINTTGTITGASFLPTPLNLNSLSYDAQYSTEGMPVTPSGLAVSYKSQVSPEASVKPLSGDCDMILTCHRAQGEVTAYEFKVIWDSVPTPDLATTYIVQADSVIDPQLVVTGVQAGITITVYVRAIDRFGRVTLWAPSVSTTTGGNCLVSQNPTFDLVKSEGGFWVKNLVFGAATSELQGVAFFAKAGSSPARTRQALVHIFKFEDQSGERNEFFVPWDEDDAYVITAPFDNKGLYYFSTSAPVATSIDLTESLIPSTDTGVVFTASRKAGVKGVQLVVTNHDINVESVRLYHWPVAVPSTPSLSAPVAEYSIQAGAFEYINFLPTFGHNTQFALVGVDKFGVAQTHYNTSNVDLRGVIDNVFEVGKSTASYLTLADAITDIHALSLSRAVIKLYEGVYVEDFELPVGFSTKLVIQGIGLPTIQGVFDVTNVAEYVSDATHPRITAGSPYNLFTLVVQDCEIIGTLYKASRTAGDTVQYPVAFINTGFTFEASVTTDPLFDLSQTQSGVDHYAVFIYDHCRIYDGETKVNCMMYAPDTSGYTDISFMYKNCEIITVDSSYTVFKSNADRTAPTTAEFRLFINNSIEHRKNSGNVYNSATGNVVFAHNSIHCYIDGSHAAQVAGVPTTVYTGGRQDDVTTSNDTNVYFDFEFLTEPS